MPEGLNFLWLPRCYNGAVLVDRVRSSLINTCGINPALPIVAGVSGGADSLALLSILVKLEQPVIAAHCNHQLRDDADSDEEFVRQTAHTLGVPFVSSQADVRVLAGEQKLSIEAAARAARYRFLFDQAEISGAQAVVTAHTSDDQAETVLLHILRGSGLTGLVGMKMRTILPAFSSQIPLIRPALRISHAELEEYCRENQLRPRLDATNFDPAYLRNRIRTELIPYLSTFNPSIKERLTVLADNAAAAIDILKESVDQSYRQTVTAEGEGFRQFDADHLRRLSAAVQIEIFKRVVEDLRNDREDIDRAAYLRVVGFLASGKTSGQTDLADGMVAEVVGSSFILRSKKTIIPLTKWPMAPENAAVLKVPGRFCLANGWEIAADWLEEVPPSSAPPFTLDDNIAYLDARNLSMPLTIRQRVKGDRFQPFGMLEGSQTLSNFFTNVKMPLRARDAWPLVIAGSQIIWVPGYRAAEGFRVDKNSRRILRLRLQKIE